MEVWVITSDGFVIGVCSSRDIAKKSVSITWGDRFIKEFVDFNVGTLVKIRNEPKIGEQEGTIVAKVEIRSWTIQDKVDHL